MATNKRSSTRSSSAGSSSRWPLLLAGVGVVVLAVVIGVVTASGRDDVEVVSVADLAGSPVIDGQDLPRFGGDTANDPAIGTRVPVTTGADFEGQTVTLGESGTPQLIAFMAAWCPACQAELPEMVDWLEDGNPPEGVELVSVATGLDATRPNWPPDAWFEREGYDAPVLVDDAEGSVAQAYGLSATPFWVALDADGQVVARVAGMISPEQMSQLASMVATS